MEVLPYQRLFIQQELSYGTSQNNQLSGIAKIAKADWSRLLNCIENILKQREWPYLQLSQNRNQWEKAEILKGKVEIGEFVKPALSLTELWHINIFRASEEIQLILSMHHALADAHSFQLFWEDLKTLYAGEGLAPQKIHFIPSLSDVPIKLGNIKTTVPCGLGEIQRITTTFSQGRKQRIEAQCLSLNLNLSSILLACLQHALDKIEPLLNQPLQTGIALRNRSGREAKQSFLSQVNFLPIAHHSLDSIKILEQEIKNSFRNQSYPLIDWLKFEKKQSAFNVLFSYQKETYHQENDQLKADFTFLPTSVDENVISMHVLEYGSEEVSISFDVRTDIADVCFWRSFIAKYLCSIPIFLSNKHPSIEWNSVLTKESDFPNIDLWKYFNEAPDEKLAIVSTGESISFGALKKRIKETNNASPPLLFLSPKRSIKTIIQVLQQWANGSIVSFANENNEIQIPSGEFLYAAETSGSTGKPKTIFTSVNGIESMLEVWRNRLSINSDSVHLSLADMRFDVFFGDIFRSIFLGGTMVLANEDERLVPQKIIELISKYHVSHLESTPSFLQMMLKDASDISSLKHLICGSEAISPGMYDALIKIPELRIYNSYGLTEVSIDSALHPLLEYKNQYPLGFPIGDQQFEIRSAVGLNLPYGVWGELYISGSCVGTPAEENDNYRKNEQGNWTYRTGDRALIHPSFGLIVSGRLADDFIKVNGKRIPAGLIEKKVSELQTLGKGCVIEKAGVSVLCHSLDWNEEKIKKVLLQYFPSYQLPDCFVYTASWPLNQNGKIDRKQLKDTITLSISLAEKWSPNNSKFEQDIFQVLKSFEKTYGTSKDSLLIYGWNSIDLLSLNNELSMKGIIVSPQHLLENPCLDTILHSISQQPEKSNLGEIDLADSDFNDILGILNQE